MDSGVPGAPGFGLMTRHRGEIALVAVAFEGLTNTRTVSAATLTLRYWDELTSPTQVLVSADVKADDTTISLSQPAAASAGDFIQIDAELLQVTAVANGGLQCEVTRGVQSSTATAHVAQTPIYRLSESRIVVPFGNDFFGSPSSGSFCYSTLLADVRIASAELYVTNANGNSPVGTNCYTETADGGLRTLSGGQFSIQVDGFLAVQTCVSPALVVQSTHAVWNIFAVVSEAPTGGTIEMDVKQNGALYCHLTIAAGATYSNVVDGFGLPPLVADALVTLDITAVPQVSDCTPGRDLTVTIRL
jgi:hypothetical protein